MLEIEDEQIIIASTMIALENRPSLKVGQLSNYAYEISRNIGMRNFSRYGFDQIFIPLAVSVLYKAGLVNLGKKHSLTKYIEVYEIEQDTICKLNRKAEKNLKKIRRGTPVKSSDRDQKEIFTNLFTIINGHLDDVNERDAFTRHMNKGMYVPQVNFGKHLH